MKAVGKYYAFKIQLTFGNYVFLIGKPELEEQFEEVNIGKIW
jgi:hypothetical protein